MNNLLERPVLIILGFFISAIAHQSVFSSNAEAKTWKVDCSKPKNTIQKVLDKPLKDGDEIEVSGNCVENIDVQRSHIRIRGTAGATITAADPNDAVVTLRGADVGITDFSSINGGTNGISVIRSAGAIISRNIVENNSANGISVIQGSFARITDNTLQNNGSGGVSVTQAHAQVFANTIVSNASQGVRVQEAAGADIDNNTITDNGSHGIFVRRTAHIALSGATGFGGANTLERNNGWGVFCIRNSSAQDAVGQAYGVNPDNNALGDFDVTNCSSEGF